MKNKILLAITFLLGLFFFSTNVRALTKINFEEVENGQVKTTLHFEEGFVGGIDITFNITGNVNVTDFKFSDKIVSADYTREFKYDSAKHTLVVRVTTGGVGSKHNLLNDKKELELGTMVVGTSSTEDVDYKLSETEFKIVGNNWESQTIAQSHIVLGETSEFVYKVNNDTSDETDDNENENNKPSIDDEKENENNNNGNSDSDDNNVVDNDSGNDENVDTEKDTESNKDQDNNDDKDDKDSEDKEEDKDSAKDKDKKDATDESEDEGSIIPWIALGVGVVLVLGGAGWYFLVFKKNRK